MCLRASRPYEIKFIHEPVGIGYLWGVVAGEKQGLMNLYTVMTICYYVFVGLSVRWLAFLRSLGPKST